MTHIPVKICINIHQYEMTCSQRNNTACIFCYTRREATKYASAQF